MPGKKNWPKKKETQSGQAAGGRKQASEATTSALPSSTTAWAQH
jgi:hypothetical protein